MYYIWEIHIGFFFVLSKTNTQSERTQEQYHSTTLVNFGLKHASNYTNLTGTLKIHWPCRASWNLNSKIHWPTLSSSFCRFPLHILPIRVRKIPQRGRIIPYRHPKQNKHVRKLSNHVIMYKLTCFTSLPMIKR